MDHLGGPHAFYNLSLMEQTDAMAWALYERNPKRYQRTVGGTGDAALDAFADMPDEEE